jgi:hypothetical protein
MATAAIALNRCSIKYHETRAFAERTRIDVTKVRHSQHLNLFGRLSLVGPFAVLTYLMDKLLSRLAVLETEPSAFLLEGEAAKIPQSLRELFRIMCDVLQKSEQEGLQRSFFLNRMIARLEKQTQVLAGFADRFEDSQRKLRSVVPPEQVEAHRQALQDYIACELKSDEATEEDLKTETLHF